MVCLLVLLVAVEACALYRLRLGGINNIAIAAIIFSVAVVPILYLCIEYEGIGMTNFMWNLFSTLTMFYIGLHYFNETMTTRQKVGVAISMAGLLAVVVPTSST